MIAELVGALVLLTRLPVARMGSGAEPGRCVWAYPIAGLAVGAISGGVFALCRLLGMGAALTSVWVLAGAVFVTGGLHEDGLADTADGLGGGATRARKLEIMRDSRIGSYGALALLLSTAMRGVAVASLAQPALALMVSGALSRGVLGLPLLLLGPARADGLAASLDADRLRALLALVLGGAAALALLPAGPALRAVAAALAGAAGVTALTQRQLGGHTGDVLGATVVVAECLVLTALAAG